MHPREPHPTAFDLRLRVGPIRIRVNPAFWISSALLGIRYYADPEQGGIGYFLFWIAAVFVSLLLHELGHAAVVRAFGIPAEAVLGGLGGVTPAIGTLEPRWRRLVAHLAGLVVQLSMIALVWMLPLYRSPRPLPSGDGLRGATAMAMFFWINLRLLLDRFPCGHSMAANHRRTRRSLDGPPRPDHPCSFCLSSLLPGSPLADLAWLCILNIVTIRHMSSTCKRCLHLIFCFLL